VVCKTKCKSSPKNPSLTLLHGIFSTTKQLQKANVRVVFENMPYKKTINEQVGITNLTTLTLKLSLTTLTSLT